MLTDAIEGAGMTVLVALDGEQALSLIERITPDVILLDAVMPGIDGFEICRRLKRNSELSHVPIIFMTGLSETEDIIMGLDAGGVDYVTKPIAPNELLARIRVHLANARISQSARAALDASGRFLLAANRAGRVLWSTPQASKLLGTVFPNFHSEAFVLPGHIQGWLQQYSGQHARLRCQGYQPEHSGLANPARIVAHQPNRSGRNPAPPDRGQSGRRSTGSSHQASAHAARSRGAALDSARQVKPGRGRYPDP